MQREIDRIVITGATSSLGTALINECIDHGIEVLAFANKGSKKIECIPKSDLISVIECSADEFINTENLLQDIGCENNHKYDAFVHFAWTSTSGDKARSLVREQVRNIEYSIDAFKVAQEFGCKVFIGAGSQAEYGRTTDVLTEDTPCYPETAYGMAKLCAGQMTRLYAEQLGIKHIWTRILSGYGPNCQPQSIINYTISELIENRSPELTGCEQIWDFIYTRDVARAILLLAQKGRSGETYVIGSGHSEPLKNYINIIKDIIEEYTRVNIPIHFGAKPYGESQVMHLACDISKLMNDTGYSSKYSFEEGIRETIEWVMSQKGKR